MRKKATRAVRTPKPTAPGPKRRPAQKAYSSRFLDRSILLLRVLATGAAEKRLADFKETGLHKSTVFRLLEALRRHRLVAMDETTGAYRLGLTLFDLGLAAVSRIDVGRVAPPFLDALVAETGETASLGIFEHPEVVYIQRVECAQPLRLPLSAGRRAPAYCTGIGKAILAHLAPALLDRYMTELDIRPLTPSTLADRAGLQAELRRIRARGWSLDDEEIFLGLRCVAAPIFDFEGQVVAGVSVAGPTSRIPRDSLAGLSSKVIATAGGISKRLGHLAASHEGADAPR